MIFLLNVQNIELNRFRKSLIFADLPKIFPKYFFQFFVSLNLHRNFLHFLFFSFLQVFYVNLFIFYVYTLVCPMLLFYICSSRQSSGCFLTFLLFLLLFDWNCVYCPNLKFKYLNWFKKHQKLIWISPVCMPMIVLYNCFCT